ncbi:hypothetical protein AYR62_10645 [Secundilactobacillus paracollinoides]|uniref:AraC family transcriptional regulator n=2 Tax=Secundilactobacillus paracollinoides TaxID=240427 RepID=UPI00081A7949|nr:AraC family transcriptional regulator [Secundilactobacillus paracollinoides]ANZ61079.1 hypothetical protein AYR61_06800 [Secundilactobacillus paracollinoides]ANZ64498.1 hypothetical protein AYR62_10645 [Secundilactobacillus paracollinoides]
MTQSAYLSLSCLPMPTFIEGHRVELELGGHKETQIHSEYFVFAFVRRGQLILMQDGVETTVHENELFILVPGRHRYSWWAQSDTVLVDCITFYVAGDWNMQASLTPAKNSIKSMMLHPVVPVQTLFLRQYQPLTEPDAIYTLVTELIKETTDCESHRFFETQGLFIRLLDLMQTQNNAQDELTQLSLALQRYLKDHYQDKITSKTLSDHFAQRGTYLVKILRQTVGLSPAEYLMQYRMEEASRKLLNTDLSIADIAMEVGFQNIYYFSTSFKKYTGVSPSKYREQGINPQE